MIEKRFESWDYHTVQQIEKLCGILPILPRGRAMTFFEQAGRLTKKEFKVVESQSSSIFESLAGILSSSDRQDFTVTYEFTSQNPAYGMLMVETYDDVLGVLFCVARISEASFLTHGFIRSDKAAVRGLRDLAEKNNSHGEEMPQPPATSSVSDEPEEV